MDKPTIDLTREIARLNKINKALIGRVERAMNMQGDAFALFQAATVLEQKIRERTVDLEGAMAELRVSNRELRQAKDTAEAAVRFKDEFLAGMSHELRTPLNAVLGLSETLQDGVYGPVNEQQLECLKTIESSGRHLLSLINDILDVAKLGAGEMRLDIESVRIKPLCEACLRFVEQQALRKQLRVTLRVSEAAQSVHTDERRLKQILVNLLSNAVKFTPNGGAVGLDVEVAGERVSFAVWDTGIGIAASDIERVFLPFVQIDSSLSRRYDGTGLGLALVHQLAALLDATVAAESEPGRGSRFSVALPLTAAEGALVLASAVEPPPALTNDDVASGQCVLLAEDNEANRITIGGYLEAKGFQVVFARTGQEAIEHVRQRPIDIVLMDVQMPEMDGLEAMRRLREQRASRRLPIIALTALAMVEDRERCIAAGADEYLEKPLVLRDLVTAIRALLKPARVSVPAVAAEP